MSHVSRKTAAIYGCNRLIFQLQALATIVAAKQKRYEKIDFTPPMAVRQAAALGLELRRKFGRGGLSAQEASENGVGSGVVRATTLSNGKAVTPETVKRMVGYFQRHQVDKEAKGDKSRGFWGDKDNPSAGYIAWLLWGGDEGWQWSQKVLNLMNEADEST